jgi:hypothetical protein
MTRPESHSKQDHWAHNPKVGGSNPPPATNELIENKQVKREP